MNKTKITFCILSLTTVLLLGICVFLYYNFKAETQKILEKKEILAVEMKKNISIDEITKSLNFSYDANEFFNNLYIKKDEMVSFVGSLEESASLMNVELEILSITEEINNLDAGPQKINLKVRARGDLENIKNHLLIMQNMSYYVEINSYSVTKDRESSQKHVSEINFNVLIK